ncbi:MAG: hypothetical protein H6722_19965 [Sandaracinus sp.]|nr:hypothetical protein [Sandaracinus sp.]
MMRSSLFFLVLAIAAGCAGGETDAVSAASTAFVGQAEPLVRVDATVWNLAPAGCEGRLGDAGLRWGVAIEAPELVVAFHEGVAVCVDSYSAVESELGTIDSPDLDGLWAGYVATLQELEPNVGDAAPGFGEHLEPLQAEPHPQPSLEAAPIAPRVDLGLTSTWTSPALSRTCSRATRPRARTARMGQHVEHDGYVGEHGHFDELPGYLDEHGPGRKRHATAA